MRPRLLVLILLAGLAAAGVVWWARERGPWRSPGTPARPAEGGWATFVDRGGGYRIQYPASWTLRDRSAGGQLIRADLRGGRDLGIQVRVHRGVGTGFEAFVGWYVARFRADMQGHWGGEIAETARRHGAIGRHRGCQVGLVLTRGDGQQWFFKEYLWPHGDRVVALQCGTRLAQRGRDEPLLDSIAATLELVGEQAAAAASGSTGGPGP